MPMPTDYRRQGRADAGRIAAAFSAGTAAGRAAWRLSACPRSLSDREQRYWRAGWMDAHEWWGVSVEGRWPVRPLPAVGGLAATG